jgi:urease accessory protein
VHLVSLPAAFEAWGPLAPEVGKFGVLRLRLAPRRGRTVITDQYWRIPLQALPPSYQDGDDEAYLYLLNPTGGIVQGDRLQTAITLEPGARAVISTQSATKVYRMDEAYAEETNHYTLEGDAVLECLPDQTIPFAGSRFYRSTHIDLDPAATLILTDLLAAGRVARGERFGFEQLFVQVDIHVGGEPCVVDRLHLSPSDGAMDRLGLWNAHGYYGSLYAYSPRLDDALATALAELIEGRDGVYGGAGQPAPGFAVARVLGPTTWAVREALYDAWDLLRRRLVGKPARPLRKL